MRRRPLLAAALAIVAFALIGSHAPSARAELHCTENTPMENLARTECVSTRQRWEEEEAHERQVREKERTETQAKETEARDRSEREEAEAGARIEAQKKAELAAIKCRPSERPVMSGSGAVCETAQAAVEQCESTDSSNCPTMQEWERQATVEYRKVHPVSVSTLRVSPTSRHGHSTAEPGHIDFRITTTPLAYITITIRRDNQAIPINYDWGELATGTVTVVRWSCADPGGTYQYTVEAIGDTGRVLTSTGRFLAVSRKWCTATKRRERLERNQRLSRHIAQERREVEERQHTTRRFENNCRAIDGVPVTVITNQGPERVCRSPNGGTLVVPI